MTRGRCGATSSESTSAPSLRRRSVEWRGGQECNTKEGRAQVHLKVTGKAEIAWKDFQVAPFHRYLPIEATRQWLPGPLRSWNSSAGQRRRGANAGRSWARAKRGWAFSRWLRVPPHVPVEVLRGPVPARRTVCCASAMQRMSAVLRCYIPGSVLRKVYAPRSVRQRFRVTR